MGDLTFSLVWNDESDLDLWVTMPSGELVWYRASNPNPTPNPSPSSNRNPNPNPNPNPTPNPSPSPNPSPRANLRDGHEGRHLGRLGWR